MRQREHTELPEALVRDIVLMKLDAVGLHLVKEENLLCVKATLFLQDGLEAAHFELILHRARHHLL